MQFSRYRKKCACVGILFKSYIDEIRSFIEASLSRELQVPQRSALVFFNCSISSEVTSTPRYIFGNLIKQLLVHCSAIPSFDRHTNALCSQFASFLHLPLPEKIYQIVRYLSAYLDEIYLSWMDSMNVQATKRSVQSFRLSPISQLSRSWSLVRK